MLSWFKRKKIKVAVARAHYQADKVGNDASALPYVQLAQGFDPSPRTDALPRERTATQPANTATAVQATEFTRPDVPAQASSGLLKGKQGEPQPFSEEGTL